MSLVGDRNRSGIPYGTGISEDQWKGRCIMDASFWKHLMHCITYCLFVRLFSYVTLPSESDKPIITVSELFESYGYLITSLVFIIRMMPLLAVPQTLANVGGLLIFNTFANKVSLKGSALVAPFFCIRVVTRGDYPELVRNNVNLNMEVCQKVGLQNFIIEVVSDKPLHLPQHVRFRETVVPDEYRTPNGALYKARALQYCLEDGVNILGDNDWIVHLDEETLMTESSVRGIVNFISDGKYHFGQGLITYAGGEVVNWLTTCTDSMRVGEDMGKLRFQFRLFHRPLFSWKGSYIVAQVSAERHVSFDHGPVGSIAEDCFFGLAAAGKGYLFNFVEGEMLEKSPFTVMDFLRQRRRWIQGTFKVAFFSPSIPFANRFFVMFGVMAWVTVPISVFSVILTIRYPVPVWRVVEILTVLVSVTTLYLYMFGMFKTLSMYRVKTPRFFLTMLIQLLCLPLIMVLENACVIYSYFGVKQQFYVVNKDLNHNRIDNGVPIDRVKPPPFDV